MEKYFHSLNSPDYLDRIDAIEFLSNEISLEEIKNDIAKCFEDSNYLVRCEAYDAFYESNFQDVMDTLVKRVKIERSKCAKVHLLATLCSMLKSCSLSDKQEDYIKQCMQKEENPSVRVAYFCILYILNDDIMYVERALIELTNKNYHVRCCVINLLAGVANKTNKKRIISAYKTCLNTETTFAVKSTLEKEIMRLSKIE